MGSSHNNASFFSDRDPIVLEQVPTSQGGASRKETMGLWVQPIDVFCRRNSLDILSGIVRGVNRELSNGSMHAFEMTTPRGQNVAWGCFLDKRPTMKNKA
jgi:hypothetical protein